MPAEPLRFSDAAAWHAWLVAHHRTAAEAVVLLSKVSVPHGLHYLEALDEAVCFGWIDSKGRRHDADHFTLRFSPRKPDSVWSESNRDRVNRLRKEGRMTGAGLAAVAAGKRSGAWQAASRPSRPPRMPSDLGEALRANPAAWAHFRAWASSYRSACIFWVRDAKKETNRERRIRHVVKRAAEDRRPWTEGF